MKKISLSSMVLAIFFLLFACSNEEEQNANERMEQPQQEEMDTDEVEEDIVAEEEEIVEVVEEDQEERTVGNYSGNIMNGGTISLAEETVYFANLFDDYRLYELQLSSGEVTKLGDVEVSDIHAIEDSLYYIKRENGHPVGIEHYSLQTKETEEIYSGYVEMLHYEDGMLWFVGIIMEGPTVVYQLDIETGMTVETDFVEVAFTLNQGQVVIQQEIAAFIEDIENGTREKLVEGVRHPLILDGYHLYYPTNDGLYVYDLEKEESTQLVDEVVDYYNAKNGHVFYSLAVEAEAARSLYYVKADGTEQNDLEVILYDLHMFDDFLIGSFSRQGGGGYYKVDFETGEISEVYSPMN
ncbi:DUF5050 domain-containing protein [Alkalihalobacterium bogoriense]|uniref:DUF5050 domain-containing protein n=1 Tax=Alkalihalobacterium bogoriense TaxID=246272 RepID=UPI00047A93F7|nr:DUF5050 domain-containing protein [Alkalihalobacterium bogoriense]